MEEQLRKKRTPSAMEIKDSDEYIKLLITNSGLENDLHEAQGMIIALKVMVFDLLMTDASK